jgi:membrane associated rhomboid family serine protease
MEGKAPDIDSTGHQSYEVVFEGIIHADFNELEVKEKLCDLAGLKPDSFKGRRIISGLPVAIKSGLTLWQAKALEEMINSSGAYCKIMGHKIKDRRIMCLRCRDKQLRTVKYQAVEMDVCPSCNGIWFEKNELDKVVLDTGDTTRPDLAIVESLSLYKGQAKLQCPGCKVMLNRYELSSESELNIDVCTQCYGIWIDRARLQQAKAFYEAPRARNEIENKKTTTSHWLFQFLLGLPVEFNVKPKSFPYVTVSLISLCTLVAAITLFYIDNPKGIMDSYGVLPPGEHTSHWLVTLITYQFLHGGVFHIGSNMYFLYILGNNLEDALGRVHFLAFYLLCGIAGALAHVAANSLTSVPIVGASGSIAGVMAGYMFIFRRAKLTFMFVFWQKKLSVVWYALIWIGFNLFGILSGGGAVAWHAHLGGFAAGLLWAYFVYDKVIEKNPLIKYLNKPE